MDCPYCGKPTVAAFNCYDCRASILDVKQDWRKCALHPDVNGKTMWGCPDCLAELRMRLSNAPIQYRERLAEWMIQHSFATGHGDTFDDLLNELSYQIKLLQQIAGH